MTQRIVFLTPLLCGWFALSASSVVAQNRGAFGTPQQGQQNAFDVGGQGRFGGVGQAGQGVGQRSQLSQGRFGQGNRFSGQGQNFGQQPFGRQDAFIGTDAEQIRQQFRNQSGRQQRRALFNFAIESLNEIRESRRRRDQRRNQDPPVRVQLRPLFAVAQPTSGELTAQVRSQLETAMPAVDGATNIVVRGSTATISGTVASDYHKQLAAKMLSLQPGIYAVENRLTVEPGPGASPQAPAP